jgi:hypothetical protein
VRLLCAAIAGEASACGERTREASRRARERINTDFNVDDPHTASGQLEADSGDNAASGHARAIDVQGTQPTPHCAGPL